MLAFGPYVVMAFMALALWGLWERHRLDGAQHDADQAVIQQNLKDRATSEKQIGILQTKLEGIDAKTQPIIQRIVSAPVSSTCGLPVEFSVDGVRDLFGPDQKPAGPVPAKPTGVPTPLGPVRKING